MRTRYIVVSRKPRSMLIYILNIFGHKKKSLACKECFLEHNILLSHARHPPPPATLVDSNSVVLSTSHIESKTDFS